MKRSLAIWGPPLLLLLVGTAAYIWVVKWTTPKPIVITASPQASSSTHISNTTVIATQVIVPTSEEVVAWQKAADEGSESWRTIPLDAAKQMSLSYGFDSTDLFTAGQDGNSSAQIMVTHGDKSYVITMYQPGQTGNGGVWAIQSIETQ